MNGAPMGARGTVAPSVIARRLGTLVGVLVAIGAALLTIAGDFGWRRAWIYLGILGLLLLIHLLVVVRKNPEVVVARTGRREGTEPFDKVFQALSVPTGVLLFVVAALDAGRYGWTDTGPVGLWAGVLLLVLGDVPILWALVVNPYLEKTVRLQEDRGHRVVTDGPYRYVRHPMYAGMALQNVGVPLILGSLWALPVAVALDALLVARTVLEDRMLRNKLFGYAEFARRTRYRLVPGVW